MVARPSSTLEVVGRDFQARIFSGRPDVAEWDGSAVLPPLTALRVAGLRSTRSIAMSRKTDTVVACTIGIDTGKNTLHLIGLDDRGAIVLREKQDTRPKFLV